MLAGLCGVAQGTSGFFGAAGSGSHGGNDCCIATAAQRLRQQPRKLRVPEGFPQGARSE